MEQYSVLMSVYKNDIPAYLDIAINSMLAQTLEPDEIIIVKDGKLTSELDNLLDELSLKNPIIKLINLQNNVGLGQALNEGLKHCQNDLIARMDADDYSLPDRCQKQVLAFESNPNLVIVSCPVEEFIDDVDNIVGIRKVPLSNKEIYKFAKRRDPFNHPSTMYRKTKVLEVGAYGDYRKNQDTDLWIKLLSNHVECLNLSEPLLRFRFDEGTYRKRKSWLNTKILIKIRYNAWRSGFNSFFDFLIVTLTQLAVYILPLSFQKNIYKSLRSRVN